MIDYKHKDLFQQDSVEKQLIISYENVVITNEDLFNQEMTLEESLCSDQQLIFGSCEASVIKFKVANIVEQMKGKWLDVKMVLEGNASEPFLIGQYKVDSDKFTADRRWKEVIAYDAMYDIINSDVIGWYNSILPDAGSTMTVKQFRTSFLEHFGIEQEDVSLINDNVVIKRTINAEELSGSTVIRAICEINGCFGHIGRDGTFRYIHLAQGMQGIYPSNDIYPADDLYPSDSKTTPIPSDIYINVTGENFITEEIEKLQIINSSAGVVSSVGSDGNCYIIENNFLLSDKTKEELDEISEKILGRIRSISYRPFDAECLGNPCFEVGDAVRLSTTYDIVETYILKRTLRGIQALKDFYSSEGVKKYEIRVNSIDRVVGQISDKADSLEEDVGNINEDIDGINDEIEDINENVGELHISLQKTEAGLEAEVSRAKTAEGDLSSRITITELEITAEVTRAKNEESNLYSRITQTAEGIKLEVSSSYATKNSVEDLSSKIDISANSIISTVEANYETKSSASTNYSNLSSSISQTAGQISSKVSKGDVVSEINQSSDTIYLGAGQLIISAGNFTLDSTGYATMNSGKIGDFIIGNYGLYGKGLSNGYTTINYDTITTSNVNADAVNTKIIDSGNSQLQLTGNGYAEVILRTNSNGQKQFIPYYSNTNLGGSTYKWNDIYAENGTIHTSDRNEKTNIADMKDSYAEQMIDGSIPKTYMMVNGSSGRTHNGLIAQDVEQQLYNIGLTTKDFAGLIMYDKEVEGVKTGETGYGLRYEEYVPILIKYAQIQSRRLSEMQNKLFFVQGELAILKQQAGGN